MQEVCNVLGVKWTADDHWRFNAFLAEQIHVSASQICWRWCTSETTYRSPWSLWWASPCLSHQLLLLHWLAIRGYCITVDWWLCCLGMLNTDSRWSSRSKWIILGQITISTILPSAHDYYLVHGLFAWLNDIHAFCIQHTADRLCCFA